MKPKKIPLDVEVMNFLLKVVGSVVLILVGAIWIDVTHFLG